MTTASVQTQAGKPKAVSNSKHGGMLLQRKCACGSPTSSLTGSCPECGSGKRLQTKLSIGASNDPLEQEADRVAEQVMRAGADPAINNTPPRIQRFAGLSSGENGTAPASVDRVLAGTGSPLEPALRQDMGQRFGYDFSRVRVHSDAAAEQSAREVNAKAYTVGHNIVFGAEQFAPGTHEGRRLIAHELTHVVQQTGAEGVRSGQSNDKRGLSPIGPTIGPNQRVSPKLIQRQGAGLPTKEPFLVKLPPGGIYLKVTPSLAADNISDEKAMNGDVVVIKNTGGAATYKKVKDGTWSWIEIPGRSSRDPEYPMLHGFIETRYIANLTVGPIEELPTLSLDNKLYDGDRIYFNVTIPKGLNRKDYAIVQWNKGCVLDKLGDYNYAAHFDKKVYYDFPEWKVDSPDTDPVYASTKENRWNYEETATGFRSSDKPGQGNFAAVKFRTELHRLADVKADAGDKPTLPTPLDMKEWNLSYCEANKKNPHPDIKGHCDLGDECPTKKPSPTKPFIP